MSKLLQTTRFREPLLLLPIHFKPFLHSTTTTTLPLIPSTTLYHHRHLRTNSLLQLHRRPRVSTVTEVSRSFSVRAFESDYTAPVKDGDVEAERRKSDVQEDKYPSGEFRFREFGWWMTFLVKARMLIALPWQRVKKGTVLTMKLRGQITDQLKSSFSSGLSLPQICENFEKAAYDPRIAGIYIHVEPLNCGWAKVEEIRRHILNFKQSGKFIVGYVPVCGEKEYYLACACDELYAPPSAYFSLYGMAVQAAFLGDLLQGFLKK